jgi:hypothetical protein
MAALGAYVSRVPPPHIGYWLALAALAYLCLVIVIDVEHRLILHSTSIVGGLLGLAIGWMANGLRGTLLGGAAGLLVMLALQQFGRLFSHLRSRRLRSAGVADDGEEALGSGDVILGGILGLILGWPMIWFGLLLGILLGGLGGLILVGGMLARGQYGRQALMVFMPYGAFFALSGLLIVFFPRWLAGIVPG